MSWKPVGLGVIENDLTGDKGDVGGQTLNNNFLFTHTDGATVNAAWFAFNSRTGASLGLTAVQIIQAAINYAVANGYTAVWIPQKAGSTTLLPYDASQVTFNNAVLMMREGGHPIDVDAMAYGCAGNNTQDDTIGLQTWITASAGRRGYLPPVAIGYKITSALTITQSCELYGMTLPIIGSGSQGVEVTAQPLTSPYIKGSVIIQSTNATDAIQVTAAGVSLRLRDLGLRFANRFSNTGHGLNVTPPALSGKLDLGLIEFTLERLYVYGHDGNHYAFKLVNCELGTMVNLRSWGGGHLWLETNNAIGGANLGNITSIQTYGMVLTAGSADGIHVISTANNQNLMAFVRPQIWVRNCSIGGVTPPTNAQHMAFFGTTGTDGTYTTIIAPDFETNVGATCVLPTKDSTNSQTSLGLVTNANADYMTMLDASSSSNGAKVWDVPTGRNWLFYTGPGSTDSLVLPNALSSASTAPAATAVAGAQSGYYAPAATSTDPTAIAGLVEWHKADSIGLADGAAVGSWADSSGSGNTQLQATANLKPIYKLNIRNGLQVVRFNSTAFMEALFTTIAQPFTIVFVAAAQTTPSQPTNSTAFQSDTNSIAFYNAASAFSMYAGSDFLGSTSNYNNHWYTYAFVFNGASSRYRVNGVSTTGNPGTGSLATGLVLGRKTGQSWNGDIGEVAVYNSAVSDGNLATLESGYLTPRWVPTPVSQTVSGTSMRGVISFGTGNTPSAGEMVQVTLATFVGNGKEAVVLTPMNAATAALNLYVIVALDGTGFSVYASTAPSSNQAIGTYQCSYIIMQ